MGWPGEGSPTALTSSFGFLIVCGGEFNTEHLQSRFSLMSFYLGPGSNDRASSSERFDK